MLLLQKTYETMRGRQFFPLNKWKIGLVVLFCFLSCGDQKKNQANILTIKIYTDSVVTNVSHHPIGINIDYFMDGDRYPNGQQLTTKALKEMGVKYLRYPGGDKSDLNLFSVPPYDSADPHLARTGKGAVDDYVNILKNYNDFRFDVLDFDEFVTMYKEVNATPVIVVPADSYLANYPEGVTFTKREELIRNAAEWVRYANIKRKLGIKHWMVGNECWHPNNKNSTAEIYAQDVVDFAKAMKAVDPTITIAANGNNEDFFKPVIQIAGDYIDYLTLSNYPVYDYKAKYITYRDTLQNLMGTVDNAMTAITLYATAEQKKKLRIIVAEYGPFDWKNTWPHINDMGHTIANFEMTGEQLMRPEIEFSCFWNTRWTNNDSIEHEVWDALDRNSNLNATGYSLLLWGKSLGDKMIKTTSTVHVRSFASMSDNTLFIYLLNKSDGEQIASLDLGNKKISSAGEAWELVGKNSEDTRPVFRKKDIQQKDAIKLSGNSIMVLQYHVE
jgi:hypothetical protein